MKRLLVIGYGNTLRRDDGVGCWAAQAVACPSAEIITAMQLTIEMAETLRHFAQVIFIDAATDLKAGEIRCQALFPQNSPPSAFSHHIAPSQLLYLCQTLYGVCPQATLFSVGGADFEVGQGLSEAVNAVFPSLITQVRQKISQRRGAAVLRPYIRF